MVQQLGLACYSVARRTGFLSTALGQELFLSTYFLYKRCYEAPWSDVVRRLAVPGSLAVDVGANVGFFTLLMAEAVGAKGRVLAFEPESSNRRLLGQVVLRKAFKNVAIVGSALGAEQGMTPLYLNPNHPADHRIWPASGVEGHQIVPITTLDHYLIESGENLPVSLVKIDVQGAELQVLRGMKKTLDDHDRVQVVIEFSPDIMKASGSDPEELVRFCRELGFSAYLLSLSSGPLPVLWEQVIGEALSAGYVDLLLSRQVTATLPA